jgi:hypothetical protein
MNLNVFDYDQRSGTVILNSADLALIDEFRTLIKRDKDRADREFTYIYLAIDWKSPYNGYSEQERHEAALQDAHITEKEWNDPSFRAACRKYRALQESNRYVRLLKSAELVTDKIIDYFNNVDLEERDEQTGKYVNKVADIQKAMENASKQIETLKMIESLVKKEIAEQSQIRAGATEGFVPDL